MISIARKGGGLYITQPLSEKSKQKTTIRKQTIVTLADSIKD